MSWLRERLAQDGACEDLDDPRTALHHARLIREKLFLRRFYEEVYGYFRAARAGIPSGVELELGSGGGFLKDWIPGVVTSDVVALDGVDRVVDALHLPYPDESLAALYLMNVLHHVPDVGRFFAEVQRALRSGGRLIAFEPANTTWARFVYRRFHHEPFEPDQAEWELPAGGRLSGANGALPWIVFVRDRPQLAARFPRLALRQLRYVHPLAYLASGGLSVRQLLPDWAWGPLRLVERLGQPLAPWTGMFMRVVMEKR